MEVMVQSLPIDIPCTNMGHGVSHMLVWFIGLEASNPEMPDNQLLEPLFPMQFFFGGFCMFCIISLHFFCQSSFGIYSGLYLTHTDGALRSITWWWAWRCPPCTSAIEWQRISDPIHSEPSPLNTRGGLVIGINICTLGKGVGSVSRLVLLFKLGNFFSNKKVGAWLLVLWPFFAPGGGARLLEHCWVGRRCSVFLPAFYSCSCIFIIFYGAHFSMQGVFFLWFSGFYTDSILTSY